MPEREPNSAETEGRFHHYTGNKIPWYVHGIWILFWSFAAYYILGFLLPALRAELLPPP
jgi:hypothetical protein